ncbi:MAG: helix-turn-helix transcriptional regulator [Pseudomonadota bacterium]
MTKQESENTVIDFETEAISAFVSQIGNKVRECRKELSLSRRVVSEKSGVSERYLAQLEAGEGNISVALLYKVARALGQSPDWFLIRDENTRQLLDMFSRVDNNCREDVMRILSKSAHQKQDDKFGRLCLIGLRGAGKSTLGRMLANSVSRPFVELNVKVEEISGMPIAEIIALYGQEGYRRFEMKALEAVEQIKEPFILSTGGGIVSEADTFSKLLNSFHTVWLKASPTEHMQRVQEQGDDRPMAGNPQAMEMLKSILTSREPLYKQAEGLIDTTGQTPEQSFHRLTLLYEKLCPQVYDTNQHGNTSSA